ncbi:hypothetical protein Cni_G25379 [Canna indica]|uniref:Class IV aminotransferase n=1 Tax=Canna indica TaxID=4628 RepID=A0AAQ3L495_9LILI|nr:hypothetical protein Cni_G25379 [Canna indica]
MGYRIYPCEQSRCFVGSFTGEIKMVPSGSSATFLVVNGVPFTGDVPPVKTFLYETTGAYTTTRTHGGASIVLFWERHLRRLVQSARILAESCPSIFLPVESVPTALSPALIDSLPDLVDDSLRFGLGLALSERNRTRNDGELAITALVRGCHDAIGLDVFLHIGFFIPSLFGAVGAHLAVVGPGRELAEAKCSNWVRIREDLEKMKPLSATELLLTNDGDRILEGTVTNFFVIRTKVVNGLTDSPSSDLESSYSFVVQTAPISDGVLPGVIRQLVIEVCSSMDIPVEEVAPSWSDHELWQEAFITSSLRLVQHVETIQFPTPFKELKLRTSKDISWITKRFKGVGCITRRIQNEISNRVEVDAFKISQVV